MGTVLSINLVIQVDNKGLTLQFQPLTFLMFVAPFSNQFQSSSKVSPVHLDLSFPVLWLTTPTQGYTHKLRNSIKRQFLRNLSLPKSCSEPDAIVPEIRWRQANRQMINDMADWLVTEKTRLFPDNYVTDRSDVSLRWSSPWEWTLSNRCVW